MYTMSSRDSASSRSKTNYSSDNSKSKSRSKSIRSNKYAASKTQKKIKSPAPMSVQTPDYIADKIVWNKYKKRVAPLSKKELEGELYELANEMDPVYLEGIQMNKRLDKLKDILKGDKHTAVEPECVRGVSNWSAPKSVYKFDKPTFDQNKTAEALEQISPKLAKILENIKKLDKEDKEKHGRKFKHFIFSDIKGSQGAKAVASALIATGYDLGYNIAKVGKKMSITVKSDEDLKKTRGNNFFLLSSVSIYGEPLRVAVKKNVLARFNSRPDNVHGELAHIIVMDSGFKEGIDLFDVKYIHIFEPQTNAADQKQVIGRGTRTCGQKGLRFNPNSGWPLYVFKYDISIPEKYQVDFNGAETAFDYYLQSKNIDLRLIKLASSLEKLVIKGSVDYKLNKPIHKFAVGDDTELSRGGDPEEHELVGGTESPPGKIYEMLPVTPVPAEENLRKKLENMDSPPGSKYEAVKKYIKKYFSEYKWPPVKMENLCGFEGPVREDSVSMESEIKGGAPNLIKLSPTQDFISNYFSVANPLKGMVLWQSVGTGKTCTAISTATRQFEPLGYTILWVTRTTLKNDIWKNMFDMVCHDDIRDKVNAGVEIPNDMPGKMKLLSNAWGIRPISYKQFTNLVSKNNQYYEKLVKRNGEQDPLRKTLLIIDEAHKLYGGGDLSSIERPNMGELHKALMNSYAVSGKDSVRVLFMTATPITVDPLEIVKLVNLCKPVEQQIPVEFETFANKYLDETGDFTGNGKKMFLDDIAGHISYLNREGDVRQFAHPILRDVTVPLVNRRTEKKINEFDVVGASDSKRKITEIKVDADNMRKQYVNELREYTKANIAKVNKVCDEFPADERGDCEKIAKKSANYMVKTVKNKTADLRKEVSEIGKRLQMQRNRMTSKLYDARKNQMLRPEKYKEYTETPYYKLKKCNTDWREYPRLKDVLETQPIYTEVVDLENRINTEVAEIKDRLDLEKKTQKSKMKSYKQLLKTNLEPNESQVVKRTIEDMKTRMKNTRRRNLKWMKHVNHRATESLKDLANYKKEVKKGIRDAIREQLFVEREIFKESEKTRKTTEALDEDLSEAFNENVQIAKDDVRKYMLEKINKEKERVAKIEAKERRREEIAERKIQKQREREEKQAANATRKQRVALEKEEKLKVKQANATRKQREAVEKQEKKEQKLREAEQKRLEKEAEKMRKEANKDAKKKK